MKNNKSINIYMGIIGEAYVDKETAYAVLLAAKKNILDVQAIIASANTLMRPLTQAIFQADEAINQSVQVYNKLKSVISQYNESDLKFAKLYALLSDLNENDFDDNFSNGGNIFTARENRTFAESLESEIKEILKTANELLDANKLNAVVRCKEYNIAKEMFEAMIPERTVSPEDVSDVMENELIKRINAVRNNIDYVNLVSDEIIAISNEVNDKIDNITAGTDNIVVKSTNEIMYWYAGNINPLNNISFMESLGFVLDTNLNTYFYQPEYDEQGNYIKDSLNKDFGINGPLRANKWFHHPKHLIQDGQLIAGVDGGKAKYQYWYVAVPRYILTFEGETEYYRDSNPNKGTKAEWAEQHQYDENLVKALYPCKPQDYEHIDDPHPHPINDNTYDENNLSGYEMISRPDNYLSINGIAYDVWRTPVTVYNKQRLNVYFNFGESEKQEVVSGMYWYIGKNKPTYDSNPASDEGWIRITEPATEENPLRYDETIDSKIFYVAIPNGYRIFNEYGVDLTLPEYEVESPYTFINKIIIGDYTYNIYITGNEEARFIDKVYTTSEQEIVPEPTGEEPTGEEPTGEEPTGEDEPGLDPSELTGKYWYAGPDMLTPNTNPEDGPIYAMNSNHIGWHNIIGTPTIIDTGSLSNGDTRINWVLAVPTSLGLNRISNGAIDVTTTFDITTVICADGVEYIVFRQAEDTKRINYKFINNNEPTGEQPEPTGEQPQINYYWYAGAGPVNASSTPGSDSNWHLISGTPTSIATGSLSNENRINWVLAVPTSLGLNHISNGALDITTAFDVTIVTCADDIEYTIFTQIEDSKRIDVIITL